MRNSKLSSYHQMLSNDASSRDLPPGSSVRVCLSRTRMRRHIARCVALRRSIRAKGNQIDRSRLSRAFKKTCGRPAGQNSGAAALGS